jgi:hypothetical protein
MVAGVCHTFQPHPRAQAHVEIRRRDNRLKTAHQFAQRGALGLKLLASRRIRLCAP